MKNKYRNPWSEKTMVKGPASYENDARAVYSANGWTVYKLHDRGFDYVFAGCAIAQRAGASDPAQTIAAITGGEEYVCDTVAAHLRANGLTCKSYEDASAEHEEMTCRERLNRLGLSTEKAGGNYRHRVVNAGRSLFEGTAHEISRWLDTIGAEATK